MGYCATSRPCPKEEQKGLGSEKEAQATEVVSKVIEGDMANSVIRRIEEVVLVGSVLVAVVCGYIFLAHLNELMEDKKRA